MNVCDDCALRLYNTKCHNLKGVGNPHSGNLVIVYNVDYLAYKKKDMAFSDYVSIIQEAISSTGELTELYIVPFIRCNTSLGCDVTVDIERRCLSHLFVEMEKYNFTNIIGLGHAKRICINTYQSIKDCINNTYILDNRHYNVGYSPLVKYTNAELYEVFKQSINKWYNAATTNDFQFYKEVKL